MLVKPDLSELRVLSYSVCLIIVVNMRLVKFSDNAMLVMQRFGYVYSGTVTTVQLVTVCWIVKESCAVLESVDYSQLSGWGPRESAIQWLGALSYVARNGSQWRSSCGFLLLLHMSVRNFFNWKDSSIIIFVFHRHSLIFIRYFVFSYLPSFLCISSHFNLYCMSAVYFSVPFYQYFGV